MSNDYSEYLKIRVTPSQKARISEQAHASGFSNTSDYARSLLFPQDHAARSISMSVDFDSQPLMKRLAAVETALSSTPDGSQALTAAQKALNLIDRKDSNDNQE